MHAQVTATSPSSPPTPPGVARDESFTAHKVRNNAELNQKTEPSESGASEMIFSDLILLV